MKTVKLGRAKEILTGLNEQNEQAEFEGRKGFWVQADCVFIEAENPMSAITQYRQQFEQAKVGASHNHFCSAIIAGKRREWLDAILVESSISESMAYALRKENP